MVIKGEPSARSRFCLSSRPEGNFGITEVGKAPQDHQSPAQSHIQVFLGHIQGWGLQSSLPVSNPLSVSHSAGAGPGAQKSWKNPPWGLGGCLELPGKVQKIKSSPWISELCSSAGWEVGSSRGLVRGPGKKNPPERGEFRPGRAFPALSRSRSPWNWEVLLQAVPVSLVGSGMSFSSTSLDFRSPLWAGILKKWTRSDAVFWG